jgi:hypothetical protein
MNYPTPLLFHRLTAIFFLSSFLAILKGIILTPYDSTLQSEVLMLRAYRETNYDSHPFFSHEFFTLYGLKFFPLDWFFSPTLHVISAITMIFLVAGLLIQLLVRSGWDFWMALFGTGFIISFGHSILSSVFDFITLAPGLQIFYGYYNPRTLVTPLALGGVLALTHKRMFLGGLLIGLATLLHIKFGLRFLGLTLFCLIAWNFLGAKYSSVKQHFSRIEILQFFLIWLVCFIIILLDIKTVEGFLVKFDQPRDANPFLSPISFALKSEPDDYFFSYHFLYQPFKVFGLFFSVLFSFFTLEYFRRKSTGLKQAMLLVCLIALCYATLNSLAGLIFEQAIIDYTPPRVQRFIVLSRFWDLFWVIASLFSLSGFLIGKSLTFSIIQDTQKARVTFFSLAFLIFWCAQIAKSHHHHDNWQWLYKTTSNTTKHVYVNSFVQVCNKDIGKYDAEWEKALGFAKQNETENFKKQLQKIKMLFSKLQEQDGSTFDSSPDITNLNILFDLKNGNFSKALRSLMSFPKVDKPILWSCHNVPENGIFNIDVKISKDDYFDVLKWLKNNSSKEQGIINPPYLTEFYMRANRIGFWCPKSDQHPMYMTLGYWPLGQARLERTAGRFAIEKTLGTANGRIGPHGRMNYLALDEKFILDIKLSYPQYELILTENQNLDFPKLYANNSFSVYKIVEK